jgi:hypothetical protein
MKQVVGEVLETLGLGIFINRLMSLIGQYALGPPKGHSPLSVVI